MTDNKDMTKKNVLMLVIDALEHSPFADNKELRTLAPTLARIIDDGYARKIDSNGMITQVAMPAIFSQTYPLDHGGFNYGIRDREKSFVEILRDSGFHTHMVCSHDLAGPQRYLERGFDTVRALFDHGRLVECYVRLILHWEVQLLEKGEVTKEQFFDYIQEHFDKVLSNAEWSGDRIKKRFFPRCLSVPSTRKSLKYRAEAELLRNDPEAILVKLQKLPSRLYEHYLGVDIRDLPPSRVHIVTKVWKFLFDARNKINWLFRALTHSGFYLILHVMSAVAREVLDTAYEQIRSSGKPWFMFAHCFDVHDGAKTSRFFNFLYKLKFAPKLKRLRKDVPTHRDFWRDLALMYVDEQIARFLDRLKRSNLLDDTIIVITADHGIGWDMSRGTVNMQELGFRTHYEHLQVPLVISPASKAPVDKGVYDSMSISATILDELDLAPHPSFLGRSLYEEGKPVSIVESVGRGNCDWMRRDLFYTITSPTHKLMMKLEGVDIRPKRLFDIENDPKERKNIINQPGSRDVVNALVDETFKLRKAIFEARGAVFDPIGWEADAE